MSKYSMIVVAVVFGLIAGCAAPITTVGIPLFEPIDESKCIRPGRLNCAKLEDEYKTQSCGVGAFAYHNMCKARAFYNEPGYALLEYAATGENLTAITAFNRFSEFARLHISPTKFQPVEDDRALAYSEADGTITISTGLIRRSIRAAATMEFGSFDELIGALRNGREQEDLQFYRAAVKPVDGRLSPSPGADRRAPDIDRMTQKAFGTSRTVQERIEMDVSKLIRSMFTFIEWHEKGHVELKHFARSLTNCAELERIEFEADQYAATILSMPGKLSNMGDLFEIAGGHPAWNALMPYHDIGFGNRHGVSGCSYPSLEARIEHIAKYWKMSNEKEVKDLSEKMPK